MTHTHPRHPNHRSACVFLWVASMASTAWAQTPPTIYTCIDAKGRRITSDRPIAECMDREQRELSPSGSVRRVIPPVPTAQERTELEAKRKADAEKEARVHDERRKERALLSRYPNEAAHLRERAKAMESVDAVDAAIHKRIEDLTKQRAVLNDEMAFYAKDPSKAPAILQRRIRDNEAQKVAQQAALQQQVVERQRVNDRFDAELQQLRQLWAAVAAHNNGVSASPAGPAAR